MRFEMNKVTWYSKLLAVILFIATFYVGFKLGEENAEVKNISKDSAVGQIVKELEQPISIDLKDVKETNFTGKIANVRGSGLLAQEARVYVNTTVDEFKAQANNDVPEMRKEFGSDSPSANYSLNIDAKYLNNNKTESIVISVYTYTGGAHGSSYYKVFTLSKKDNKMLSISDLIKKEKEYFFTEQVKKELNDWRPEGSTTSPLFPEVVNALSLKDFSDWSLDDENLIIYFGQYAIGPGVIGQVAFPIPLSKIQNLLNENV